MNLIKTPFFLNFHRRLAFFTRQWASNTNGEGNSSNSTFDEDLLDMLVCPLSKDRLRYDEKTNELINDKLGVAYPITDGIPQLAPEDGRLLQTGKNQSDWST